MARFTTPRASSLASAPRARRSSSASPVRWQSASPRPRACCGNSWRAGRGRPASSSSRRTGSCYPTRCCTSAGCLSARASPSRMTDARLRSFVWQVKSGAAEVHAPVYSHITYDIVPGASVAVERPDVLIVEGLNVLQPPYRRAEGGFSHAISDYFDVSIYVDAHQADVRRWYIERFLELRQTAFARPDSLLQHLRRPHRRGGDRARRPDLGHHQRAQPGAEHRADAFTGDDHLAQGSEPPGGVGVVCASSRAQDALACAGSG